MGDPLCPLAPQKIYGPKTYCAAGRKKVIEQIAGIVTAGDVIAVMGARDDTLSEFARAIAEAVS